MKKIDEQNGVETYLLTGSNIDDLVEDALKRVRSISKDYYRKALREGLEQKGESKIDRHAGMGQYIKVKLL
jgi:putative alpha-1,2-mannosidase